jgi:hypothetical protein
MIRALAFATAAVVLPAGTAWAAGLTLSSAHLGASPVSVPTMYPMTVALGNKNGGTVGKVQNGDTIGLVWSQQLDETTLCSGWSNSSSSQSLTLQWSVVNGVGTADDTLQVTGSSSTCVGGLQVGTVDLGSAGYDTSTAAIDFPTTTNVLTVGAATTTLTVTLNGQVNGTAATVGSGRAAVWTPTAAVKDRSGRGCGANLAQSTTTVQF